VDGLNAARLAKKVKTMDALLTYLSTHPYASLAEAGQAIGRSKTTVGNYVAELTTSGQLARNGNGWEVS
jgi:DNA-binding IclR family transcriptional regulator